MLFDDKSKGIAQAYLSMLEAKKKEDPKMDPVGKEDGDVDNDGDKDSSDEYLKKRRAAISKSVKEEKVDEASCGAMPKAKKEAIEITIGGKSEVSKKGMKDKEGGDEEEEDDDNGDDDEVEVKTKKKDDDKGSDDDKKKKMPAFMQKKEGYKSDAQRKAVWAARNEKGIKEAKAVGSAYAIGMSTAMKSTGDEPPLEKSTIKKAHKIAKSIMKKESTVWDWDSILEASDEELDTLIEQLEGEDLESFVSEFSQLSEMYPQAKQGVDKAGQEKLEPRAPAEKAFAGMHKSVEKDHPFDKDQHDQGVKSQAAARPGDKRANEPMKTLKDIRK